MSVQTTPMQLPVSPRPAVVGVVEPPADRRRRRRAAGASPPKLASTSTPTVPRPSSTRDEVPIPALCSIVIIPVPAPTTPSATGPSVAASIAARPSATVTLRRRDVVEPGVVALADDRGDDVVVADGRDGVEHGVDDGVVDAADRRRAGEHDRGVEEAAARRWRSSR